MHGGEGSSGRERKGGREGGREGGSEGGRKEGRKEEGGRGEAKVVVDSLVLVFLCS